jgi:hypothetical protein
LHLIVAVIQAFRLAGKVVGLAFGLLPLLPQLAAPPVETGEGQIGVGAAIVGVALKGLVEYAAGLLVRNHRPLAQQIHAPQPAVVSRKTGQGLSMGFGQVQVGDAGGEGAHHLGDDIVLDLKNGLQGAW